MSKIKRRALTQDRLKEVIRYDPETGIFTWRVYRSQIARPGNVAGQIKNGYRYIVVDGVSYRAARLAWLYMEGYFPEHEVDHKDRVRDNDKWENLVHKTPQCNSRNRGLRRDNKSGVPGVIWNKQNSKWQVSIKINPKKRVHLGYYTDLVTAAKARWEGEIKYCFPNCQTTSPARMFLKEHGAI